MAKARKLRVHPAAGIFPKMSDEDYERLKLDIKQNGVLEPVKTLDGMLLDGRHREKVCIELEIECPTWPISKDEMGELTPHAWVIAENLARRHLTAAQRAAIGAEHLEKIEPTSGMKDLLGKVPKGRAAAKAAKAVGVARSSIERARAIKKKNPAAFMALKEGTVSLREAEADVVLDGMGKPVTRQKSQAAFRTRAKMVEAARYASRARAILKECVGQPGAEELIQAGTMTKLGAARQNITDQMPHIVCPDCDGVASSSCEKCTSRGWVTKSEAA